MFKQIETDLLHTFDQWKIRLHMSVSENEGQYLRGQPLELCYI